MAADTRRKQAREYVRRNAVQCPCCGGSVLLSWTATEPMDEAMNALADAGALFALVSAEEAEEEIATHHYKPLRPIGSDEDADGR